MYESIIRVCLFFVLMVLIHIPLCRKTGNAKFVFRGLMLEVFALAIFIPVEIFHEDKSCVFIELVAMVCLWNMYLFFLINMQNSFSLRMMLEISKASGQRLSKTEINLRFSDADSFNARLKALELNGFLRKYGHQLILLPKGKTLGKMILRIRSLLGVKEYG
jgi:hypothetical protein